jgi:hypothetical protein
MAPRDSDPVAGSKRAARYVSLRHGQHRPFLDGQVAGVLARFIEHGLLAVQARLCGDVDRPQTGPRWQGTGGSADGAVARTTTNPDDRALLVTAARHHGFTYTDAAAAGSPHGRLRRAGDAEARGSGVGYPV